MEHQVYRRRGGPAWAGGNSLTLGGLYVVYFHSQISAWPIPTRLWSNRLEMHHFASICSRIINHGEDAYFCSLFIKCTTPLKKSDTAFENDKKCRISSFQFWYFPPIFLLASEASNMHSVWKTHKMSHLNSSILVFPTNFCHIKIDLSGSTVWPQV